MVPHRLIDLNPDAFRHLPNSDPNNISIISLDLFSRSVLCLHQRGRGSDIVFRGDCLNTTEGGSESGWVEWAREGPGYLFLIIEEAGVDED